MRSAVAILLCCAVTCAAAQGRRISVKGYVRDGGTGEAIAGAVIAADGGTDRTTANPTGYYSLSLAPGSHTLTCASFGYAASSVEIYGDTVLNFSLAPQYVALEEVVVRSDAEPVVVRDLGNIDINMQRLKYVPLFLGERDIIKFMHILPGVSPGREGSSQLSVRGGGGDQTLLMLDETPVYNQNHALGVVSIFNGEALSGVELYKGYIPARYGGRLSSVAAIRMRDGNKYEHRRALTLGTLTVGATAEGPIVRGRGSYIFSVRGFIPGLLLPAVWAAMKNDLRVNYSFYDVTAKVNYRLNERNTAYASFYTGRDRFSVDDREYGTEPLTGQKTRLSDNGVGYDWGNLSGSLRLGTILAGGAFMNTSLYFSRLSNHIDSYYKDHETGERMNALVTSALYEAGVRWAVEHRLGSAHRLDYGLNASVHNFSPQTTTYTRANETSRRSFATQSLYSASLFAEDRLTTGIFTLNMGARLSLYRRRDAPAAAFEPRLGLTAELNENNRAWVSLIRSTQPLYAVTKINNGLPLDFWLPYSERIESAWQANAGWTTSKIKNLLLTVECYYKRMDHLSLIYSVDDYLLEEADPLPARGYAWGAELLAQYTLSRFSLTGAYTCSRSMRHAEGVTFPYSYDAPHDLNLFATYTTLKRGDRRHTLSINTGYRTGYPYSVATASYPGVAPPYPSGQDNDVIYETPRYPNTRMPDYFRTDISFAMERQKRTGIRTWQFSVLNVTNHFNPIMIYPTERSETGFRAVNIVPFMPSFSYHRTF